MHGCPSTFTRIEVVKKIGMSGLTVVRVNPPAYSAMLPLVLDLSRREQASLWQIGGQAAVDDFPNFDTLTFVAGFFSRGDWGFSRKKFSLP